MFWTGGRPALIGMIHLRALPGTPKNSWNLNQIVEKAVEETEILKNFDGLIVENMHDLPYVKNVGPEILTSMTVACM